MSMHCLPSGRWICSAALMGLVMGLAPKPVVNAAPDTPTAAARGNSGAEQLASGQGVLRGC